MGRRIQLQNARPISGFQYRPGARAYLKHTQFKLQEQLDD